MAKKRDSKHQRVAEQDQEYGLESRSEQDLAMDETGGFDESETGDSSNDLADVPPPPRRPYIPETWEHKPLHARVIAALEALPAHWRPANEFSGIPVTDLHTLAANLGATIEDQVVETLNFMRPVWDPERRYGLYRFVRQPQAFPDVLLRKNPNNPTNDDIVFGIELKGWYLLAKEGMGNFRFKASPTACNAWDLLVIVPWSLANVTSGVPKVFSPYVESAKFAAEYRNWHWQYKMKGNMANREVRTVTATPYPRQRDEIADEPVHDKGKNFGRIFRTGIMDEYLKTIDQQNILGIPAWYWRVFFRAIEEARLEETLGAALERLRRSLDVDDDKVDDLVAKLRAFLDIWKP